MSNKRSRLGKILCQIIAIILVFNLSIEAVMGESIDEVGKVVSKALGTDKIGTEEKNGIAAEDINVEQEFEPEILEEVTELRDATTKHFMMNDLTFMAVEYEEPVHYIEEVGEDGKAKWKDIDNTLTPKNIKGKIVYENVDNVFKAKFSEDLDSEELFTVDIGGKSVTFALLGRDEANYKELSWIDSEEGIESTETANIDNTVSPEETSVPESETAEIPETETQLQTAKLTDSAEETISTEASDNVSKNTAASSEKSVESADRAEIAEEAVNSIENTADKTTEASVTGEDINKAEETSVDKEEALENAESTSNLSETSAKNEIIQSKSLQENIVSDNNTDNTQEPVNSTETPASSIGNSIDVGNTERTTNTVPSTETKAESANTETAIANNETTVEATTEAVIDEFGKTTTTQRGNKINKEAVGQVFEKKLTPKALKDKTSQFTELEKITSKLKYTNSFKNTDLEYQLIADGVKENIIINSVQEQYIYDFEMKLNGGLTPVCNKDGSITIYHEVYKKISNETEEMTTNPNDAPKEMPHIATAEEEALILKELEKEKAKKEEWKWVSEPLFYIPAPYMYDANDKYSEAVHYELIKTEGNTYILRIIADSKWINAEERAFPVVVDPIVRTVIGYNSISRTYVNSASPNTALDAQTTYYAGIRNSGDRCRTYVYTAVPAIKNGDVISKAILRVRQNRAFVTAGEEARLNLTTVRDDWFAPNITWNNKPATCKIVDYVMLKNEPNTSKWLQFDVTSAVREWYMGKSSNEGFCLSLNSEALNYTGSYVEIDANHNVSSDVTYPYITLYYMNRKGIQDHWSFSSSDMGTAGTAMINNYTGNVLISRTDVAMSGSRMPANISFTYDGLMKNTGFVSSGAYTYTISPGYGWKMNLQQTIRAVPSSMSGTSGYKYVYADATGTEHYFYQTGAQCGNKLIDESGSGYELTVKTTGYTIKDKSRNTMEFDGNGWLKTIKDNNGNSLTITYSSASGAKGRISYVTDGAGRVTTFVYNSYNYLQYIEDPVGRRTTFRYSSTYNATISELSYGYLRMVKYSDGNWATYNYNSDGTVAIAFSTDSTYTKFTYATSANATYKYAYKRLGNIEEVGSDGGMGAKVGYSYLGTTTRVRTVGKDDIYNTIDDTFIVYNFDNYGRCTNMHVEDFYGIIYSASESEYIDWSTSDTAIYKNNKLSESASIGRVSTNIKINDPEAEESGNYWLEAKGAQITATFAKNDTYSYYGAKSLEIKSTSVQSSTVSAYYRQSVSVPAGTYTFSAYVRASGLSAYSGAAIEGAFVELKNISTGSINSSAMLLETTNSIDKHWVRLEATVYAASTQTLEMRLCLRGATGSVRFDNMQLNKDTTAGEYSFIRNGDFENGLNNWTVTGIAQTATGKSGNALELNGTATTYKSIYQSIPIKKKGKQAFILSGWYKTGNVPSKGSERMIGINVSATYDQGHGTSNFKMELAEGADNWTYFCTKIIVGDSVRTIENIGITLFIDRHDDYVYFDEINLSEANSIELAYNDNGNVIRSNNNKEQKNTSTYSTSNKPLTETSLSGNTTNYTYDTKDNPTKVTTASNLKTEYTYDSYGNTTSTKVGSLVSNIFMKSQNTYTNGNYISTSTDARGKVTTYSYNTTSGLLQSVTDPKGTIVRYEYYPDSEQIKRVYSTSNGTTTSVEYMYNSKDYIENIISNGTRYTFAYDAYGNIESIKIGSRTLSTNTFNSYDGKQTGMTYGNGTTIGTVYNELNQAIAKKINGIDKFKWTYNGNGEVKTYEDLVNAIGYTYLYDTLGRLTQRESTVTDGVTTKYTYDKSNRITTVTDKFPSGVSGISRYTYTTDDRVSVVDFTSSGIGAKLYVDYDALSRYSMRRTYFNAQCTNYISERYAYEAGWSSYGTGATTALPSKVTYQDGTTISYSYDNNGNISSINNFGTTTSYTYDALNQLTKEVTGSAVRDYTYNSAGNITSKKVNGTTTSTYGYTDSTWKDLLTSYNGTTITYDTIGNPLSYRNGMTMTWQNGRQLRTLTKSGSTSTYQYDADGIRTQKVSGGVTTKYYLDGSTILAEKRGSNWIYYTYDENGSVIGMKYNNVNYYFQKNIQGDIIRIYKQDGSLLVKYTYDAWGNILSTSDTSGIGLSQINPFRYRGYYYDTESGFYYLNSRYYDPATSRFINADGQLNGGLLGNNLFAYCYNDPVNYFDDGGNIPVRILMSKKGYTFGTEGGKYQYDLKNGYGARFDQGKVGNRAHVHIGKNVKDDLAFNLADGTQSHAKRNNNKPPENKPPRKKLKKLKELTGFDLEGIWEEEERKKQEGNNELIDDSVSYVPPAHWMDVGVRYFTSGAYRSVLVFTFFTGAGGYTEAADEAIVSGSEIFI